MSIRNSVELKATHHQLTMLVEYMYRHRLFALSKTVEHVDQWNELANMLNKVGRSAKTPKQWAQIWRMEVIDSLRADILWKHCPVSEDGMGPPKPNHRQKLVCVIFESAIIDTNELELMKLLPKVVLSL